MLLNVRSTYNFRTMYLIFSCGFNELFLGLIFWSCIPGKKFIYKIVVIELPHFSPTMSLFPSDNLSLLPHLVRFFFLFQWRLPLQVGSWPDCQAMPCWRDQRLDSDRCHLLHYQHGRLQWLPEYSPCLHGSHSFPKSMQTSWLSLWQRPYWFVFAFSWQMMFLWRRFIISHLTVKTQESYIRKCR